MTVLGKHLFWFNSWVNVRPSIHCLNFIYAGSFMHISMWKLHDSGNPPLYNHHFVFIICWASKTWFLRLLLSWVNTVYTQSYSSTISRLLCSFQILPRTHFIYCIGKYILALNVSRVSRVMVMIETAMNTNLNTLAFKILCICWLLPFYRNI